MANKRGPKPISPVIVRKTFSLPEEIAIAIEQYALENGILQNGVVTRAIKAFIYPTQAASLAPPDVTR